MTATLSVSLKLVQLQQYFSSGRSMLMMMDLNCSCKVCENRFISTCVGPLVRCWTTIAEGSRTKECLRVSCVHRGDFMICTACDVLILTSTYHHSSDGLHTMIHRVKSTYLLSQFSRWIKECRVQSDYSKVLFSLKCWNSSMQENPEEDVRSISIEYLQNNLKQIDVARTFLSIVAGVFAGVLGCESMSGLLCFVVLYVLIAFSMAIKMSFDTKMFTNSSLLSFVAGDLQKNGLSFILFWTLAYALIYIYWIKCVAWHSRIHDVVETSSSTILLVISFYLTREGKLRSKLSVCFRFPLKIKFLLEYFPVRWRRYPKLTLILSHFLQEYANFDFILYIRFLIYSIFIGLFFKLCKL